MARRLTFGDEPISRLAAWSRRFALFALAVAVLSIIILRSGLLEIVPALATFGAALVFAGLSILFAFGAFITIWRQGLAGLFSEAGEQAQAVGIGPMFQVFFNSESVADYQGQIRADRPRFERFATKMFERNIFVSRRAKNYISTAHTESDLDEFLTTARAVLRGGLDA